LPETKGVRLAKSETEEPRKELVTS